jgi:Brp/Blh family beta-carotene 15,15'-monooxygenase
MDGHALVFTAIGTAVLVFYAFFGSGSTGQHLILLIILLPIFGVPHGALDYPLAKQFLFPHLGQSWPYIFLAGYLLVMAIVLIVWWFYPTFSFIAFLTLTLYHFGSGDATLDSSNPFLVRIAEFLGRGGLLLTFPAVFDRQNVLQLFSYLVPEQSAGSVIEILVGIMPYFAFCLVISVLWSLFKFIHLRERSFLFQAVELTILALLFILLPALLAFCIYFSFLHSIRHMLHLSPDPAAGSPLSALKDLTQLALPVTGATLVLGGAAYFLLSGVTFDIPNLVRVIIIGIACMTYPHAIMVAFTGRSGGILFQRDGIGMR